MRNHMRSLTNIFVKIARREVLEMQPFVDILSLAWYHTGSAQTWPLGLQ